MLSVPTWGPQHMQKRVAICNSSTELAGVGRRGYRKNSGTLWPVSLVKTASFRSSERLSESIKVRD